MCVCVCVKACAHWRFVGVWLKAAEGGAVAMASPCDPPQGKRFHGSDGIAHYEFEWDFSRRFYFDEQDKVSGN